MKGEKIYTILLTSKSSKIKLNKKCCKFILDKISTAFRYTFTHTHVQTWSNINFGKFSKYFLQLIVCTLFICLWFFFIQKLFPCIWTCVKNDRWLWIHNTYYKHDGVIVSHELILMYSVQTTIGNIVCIYMCACKRR